MFDVSRDLSTLSYRNSRRIGLVNDRPTSSCFGVVLLREPALGGRVGVRRVKGSELTLILLPEEFSADRQQIGGLFFVRRLTIA